MMDTFQNHFDNDNKCINVIHEFLVHYEFTSTLSAFLSETPRLGFTLPQQPTEIKPHIRRDDIAKIFSTFQSENYKQFFEIWHMTIPSSIKNLKDYKRLTFHLYVYFATLPFRKNRKKIIPIEVVEIVDENEKVDNKTVKFEPELDRISETCEKPTSNENAISTDEEDNNNVVTAMDKKFTTFKDLGEGINNNLNESLVINTSEESVKKIINSNYKEYGGEAPSKLLQPEDSINMAKRTSVTPEETGSSRNSIDSLEVFKIDASGKFREVRNSIDSLEVYADARIESTSKFIEAEMDNSTIEQKEKEIVDRLVEKAINNNETELVFVDKETEQSNKLNTRNENDINSANNSIHILEDINIDFIEKEKNKVADYNMINILKNNEIPLPIEVVESPRLSTERDAVVPELDNEETMDNSSVDVDVVSNESAMDVLKTFLTTKGPEFSSEPEFLPFFALPFINNPKEHPSFMDIFKESWAETLEKRLVDFVEQYSYGESVAPSLIKQYSKPIIVSNNNSRVSSARLTSINEIDGNRRYKNLKHKFQKLHRDHQNLIGVAAELTTALENSVRGQAVDLKATLCNCVKIFPELFSKPGDDSMSTFQIKKDYGHEYNRISTTPCYHLDVQKIKQHLATGSMKTKLLLIQALRWRLTRSSSDDRDHTVLWLSQHDVFSLRATVLEDMLAPPGACTPHPLQQAVARLLNTVASLRCGRDYLAPSHALLSLLVATLRQQRVKIDQTTADMLLATLQKLSLRKNQRMGMIENGMVEWLIEKMKGDQNRSYTLEYSSALLMNLCLHNEARQRFPPLLLSTLIQLLDSSHTQIVPVISGTLYCLLTREEVNNVAKDLNLERTIQIHIQRFSAEPAMVRQLETLLKLHKGELPPDAIQTISEEPNEDEMEDPDELERELDFDDPVRAMPGDLSGDDLLNTLYSCPSSDMCH